MSTPFPRWRLDDAAPLETLAAQGFVKLSPARLAAATGVDAAALAALARHWEGLPPDPHLRDGGRYRRRRHASLLMDETGQRILRRVERPHWQPTDYNALHGGFERWFAPFTEALLAEPALPALLAGLGRLCAGMAGRVPRFVEAHAFRIDTTDGIGRPTPEGAHRDGVDFVAVLLLARHGVRGGETRVFEAEGPAGLRFTMAEPGTTLLLDDARVVHETTPLQPEAGHGHRDTLVITWRFEGFLDPPDGPRPGQGAASDIQHER
ncbi:2OG-Fe dioxygenase family protein [Silanimonas lenta]|uniref:2OG-Fe dioxygenase family protein n=1 Tax=Silanimonas lenta TaxID=265429 RepID=UPI002FE1258C